MERQQLHWNGPWVEMSVLTCGWVSCIILSLTWWSIVSEDCFMAAIWSNAPSPAMTIKTILLLSQQAATVTRGNRDGWGTWWYGCPGNEGLQWPSVIIILWDPIDHYFSDQPFPLQILTNELLHPQVLCFEVIKLIHKYMYMCVSHKNEHGIWQLVFGIS